MDAKRIAIHEAGHEVVSEYLRIYVDYVTIESDSNSLGHLYHDGMEDWQQQPGGAERMATQSLAGRAAEELLCGSLSDEQEYGGDEYAVVCYSGFEDATGETFGAWRARCLDQARELVRKPCVQAAIRAVADELLSKTELPGEDLRRLLRSVEGWELSLETCEGQ